jgi:hypothetical protein
MLMGHINWLRDSGLESVWVTTEVLQRLTTWDTPRCTVEQLRRLDQLSATQCVPPLAYECAGHRS